MGGEITAVVASESARALPDLRVLVESSVLRLVEASAFEPYMDVLESMLTV